MNIKLPVIFLVLINAFNYIQAQGLRWKDVKTIAYDVKSLPKEKILFNFYSPDNIYNLISYQEKINKGNSLSLYSKNGNQYRYIDNYKEITNIKWSDNSSKVYFEAIKDLNHDEISYWKITYFLKINVIFAQVLQIQK